MPRIGARERGGFEKRKREKDCVHLCVSEKERESEKQQRERRVRLCASSHVCTSTEMDHLCLYLLRGHA